MMFSVRTPAVLGRRACALLAAFSAGLHGLMVGEAGNVVVGGIVLAMAAACLYCARELWVGQHGAGLVPGGVDEPRHDRDSLVAPRGVTTVRGAAVIAGARPQMMPPRFDRRC